MESELCLSKKYSLNTDSNRERYLPEIIYHHFDERKDFSKACMLYWEFYLQVAHQDLSKEITLEDGLKILEVESHVNHYLKRGCEISMATSNGDSVGILIYHRIYSQIISAWVAYVKPEYESRHILIGLLRSINPKPKKVIFQTINANPNDRLIKITEGERTLLHSEPIHTTWMVNLKE